MYTCFLIRFVTSFNSRKYSKFEKDGSRVENRDKLVQSDTVTWMFNHTKPRNPL